MFHALHNLYYEFKILILNICQKIKVMSKTYTHQDCEKTTPGVNHQNFRTIHIILDSSGSITYNYYFILWKKNGKRQKNQVDIFMLYS
ncbi:hypothetical protein BpHYR1_019574 [Brachionus plicatilis]|uniref:Uncharacterized protein n=1 Tax=Brachionus plicatilis TaxID=10195 RepID=A0A3M7Q3E8_BRAPC|nr:hypothetical protein BpHYR1_019574 [Brachionus plicatilis]